MKKFTANLYLRHGFTLIELMIVIVILGVLMGTILPRLTGAQARARDTGRIADLGNIAQAMEVYYNDHGSYPADTDGDGVADATDGTLYCLRSADEIGSLVKDYLKGTTIPEPPSKTQATTVGGTTCTGEYGYVPLARNGVEHGSYLLITDAETWQMANAASTDIDDPDYANITLVKPTAEDATDATVTVYVYRP